MVLMKNHRSRHLDAWSSVAGAFWGVLRGRTLLEEWSHWGNFWGFVVSPQVFLSASCLWFKILFICILCVWAFYMHVCKCDCVFSAHRGQMRTDLPELELQIFASCSLGAGSKFRFYGNIISVINHLATSSLLAPWSVNFLFLPPGLLMMAMPSCHDGLITLWNLAQINSLFHKLLS